MTSAPSSGLVEGTISLLHSQRYSDLTITTNARSFKLHKAIVCTQSKVLAAMSDSGFKETSTSTLVLEDDDPATVERMITFLYAGTYDDGNPATSSVVGAADPCVVGKILMANTRVYAIADKYDIGPLKWSASAKFRNVRCCDAWKCENFSNVVLDVFDTTPENDLGLRNIVSHYCARHIDDVLASKSWNEFLKVNGAIGLSIFKVVRERGVAKCKELEEELKDVKEDLKEIRSICFDLAMPVEDD